MTVAFSCYLKAKSGNKRGVKSGENTHKIT